MLLGFYSGLVVFILLFIIVFVVFIKTLKLRQQNTLPAIMLGVLLVFTGVISSIYSVDFYFLKSGQTKSTSGACSLEYVTGNGNSMDSTDVTIGDKTYSIKSSRFKEVEDGQYNCTISYLPITKIVTEISLSK